MKSLWVQEEFLGEKYVQEEFLGEKYVQEEFLGEKYMGARRVSGCKKGLCKKSF